MGDGWLPEQFLGAKKEAAMKRCAQCHGKLGLGVRTRNLWNGRSGRDVRQSSAEEPDHRHRLLRARRERPRSSRAAEPNDRMDRTPVLNMRRKFITLMKEVDSLTKNLGLVIHFDS